MSEIVRITFHDHIGILTLFSDDQENRFDIETLNHLQKLLSESKDNGCSSVILTHEGPNFCKGGDISSLSPISQSKAELFAKSLIDTVMAIYCAPFTVIAALEGNVEGGGICLVESCDLVVASTEVTFSIPEALTGMPPVMSLAGAFNGLTDKKAMELALLSTSVKAEQCPITNLTVPKGTAFSKAIEWAESINIECAKTIKEIKIRLGVNKWRMQLQQAAELLPNVLMKRG